MGSYVTVYLVYGTALETEWEDDDVYMRLDEALSDTPLEFASDGAEGWDDYDRTWVLYPKGSAHEMFETAEALGVEGAIEPPSQEVLADCAEAFERVSGRQWKPQWWIVGSYG